ncbi:MAG TPA: glycoside hydrolase family 3 N-terminal domain-containing protein [Nitrolancea sp.]
MESRRTFLKKLMALGAAVPFAGTFERIQSAVAGPMTGSATFAAPLRAQASLSSRQRAGQRVIYSYPGLTVPQALLDKIAAGEVGGVIFFGENVQSSAQIASVTAQLRQAQQRSPVSWPLLLMTDQEGGQVRRLPGGPEQSAKQVGASANPSAAASEAGSEAGQTLAAAGMNVNLAPVLDVYRQAGDFDDQFERSFSTNPATVGVCATAFVSAQQNEGVAATVKHFPGLGAASSSENTDAVPVTLSVSLNDLRSIDEVPFASAINAGARLVMTSWAIYPALDPNNPAGLSRTIVQNELRGRLGFKGVTITDALEAGSLGAFGNNGQRAVKAVQAGMDLILCSARDVSQGEAVTTALANALDGGQINRTEFDAALQRISTLRNGSSPSTRFFPETGHTLGGGFLAYWNKYGGLPVFGYPITEEYTDASTGFVTQYLERARFEWHPGAWPERFDVELGLLGVELAQKEHLNGTTPFQPIQASDDANCTFYEPTGHRLCFGFRDFWQSNGGLAIYGYPISEEFRDAVTGFTVQYFERQRLEYHPENPPEWQVEGGLLGRQLLPPGK